MEDAGVFFARDYEVRRIVDRIGLLRLVMDRWFILLMGPSGSATRSAMKSYTQNHEDSIKAAAGSREAPFADQRKFSISIRSAPAETNLVNKIVFRSRETERPRPGGPSSVALTMRLRPVANR